MCLGAELLKGKATVSNASAANNLFRHGMHAECILRLKHRIAHADPMKHYRGLPHETKNVSCRLYR